MFENELLNAFFAGFFGILIPALLAIKFLSWLSVTAQAKKTKRLNHVKQITMQDRLAKRTNTTIKA